MIQRQRSIVYELVYSHQEHTLQVKVHLQRPIAVHVPHDTQNRHTRYDVEDNINIREVECSIIRRPARCEVTHVLEAALA